MSEAEAKAFTTLQARAALIGYTCSATGAGNIVLSRLGGAWIFDDVPLAADWLARVPQPLGVPA